MGGRRGKGMQHRGEGREKRDERMEEESAYSRPHTPEKLQHADDKEESCGERGAGEW